ncbi:MAG: hypothetical protein WC477_06260 [Patescibacteria group bacterium]
MDHLYTFKELAGYVTITGCMAFLIGFLIAVYTRIFAGEKKQHDDYIDWSKAPEWAKYIFVQPSGTILYSEIKPIIEKKANDPNWWYEPSEHGKICPCSASDVNGPLPPWRESLLRRPS